MSECAMCGGSGWVTVSATSYWSRTRTARLKRCPCRKPKLEIAAAKSEDTATVKAAEQTDFPRCSGDRE